MLRSAVARGVPCQAEVSCQVGQLKRFRAPASGSPFVAVDVTDGERTELVSQLHGLLKEAALPPTRLECSVDLALRVGRIYALGDTSQEDEALAALKALEGVPFSRALAENGIGKAVNALRVRSTSEEVKHQAKVLLLNWRNGLRSILRKSRTVAMDLEHEAHSIVGGARSRYHSLAGALVRELQPHRATANALMEDRLAGIPVFVRHLASVAEHEQRALLAQERARVRSYMAE